MSKTRRSRQSMPVHSRVKEIVPNSANAWQVGLRWTSYLAASLTAVLVGIAIDAVGSGGVSAGWWLWFVATILLGAVSISLATYQASKTQSEAERRFRALAQSSWNDLGTARVRDRTGQLLDLATNGAMRAARYRGAFLSSSMASLSAPLIVCVVMGFWLNWAIAGWMVLIIVVGPFLIEFFQRRTRASGNDFRRSQVFLRASFLEGINALESLVYARAGTSYARGLAEANEKHRRRIMSLLAGNQTLIFFMDIIFSMAAILLATYLGLSGYESGSLTLGGAIGLLILTVIMVGPVDLIGQFFYIAIGGRATQRQFSALAAEAEAASANPKSSQVAEIGGPAVAFSTVTGGWREDKPLLTDTTWQVEPGERVVIIGPSGIGKSTISALIQGQIDPFSGSVMVNGLETTAAGVRQVNEQLAVVEQRTYLFNGTIADNLRLADAEATDDELWAALDTANLGKEVRSFSQGLDTVVGDRGSRLSGGQAQRLALARAFLKQSPILILDEPTSQVDLAGEALILDAIEKVAQDRTVIMIAHRRAAIDNVDRILEVTDQKVVAVSE